MGHESLSQTEAVSFALVPEICCLFKECDMKHWLKKNLMMPSVKMWSKVPQSSTLKLEGGGVVGLPGVQCGRSHIQVTSDVPSSCSRPFSSM